MSAVLRFWRNNILETDDKISKIRLTLEYHSMMLRKIIDLIDKKNKEPVIDINEMKNLNTGRNLSTMEEIERTAIENALEANNNNKEQTARSLKISVRTLYRKLKSYKEEKNVV